MYLAIGSGWASSTDPRQLTTNRLGEAASIECLDNLHKNRPELGLECGTVLPVKSLPDCWLLLPNRVQMH
jgi:hypothetical protein